LGKEGKSRKTERERGVERRERNKEIKEKGKKERKEELDVKNETRGTVVPTSIWT